MRILLGLDDTDVLGHRPGTGRLARELGAQLAADGIVRLLGVVRQQLLVDPRIPYTSHNSPACLVLDVADDNGAARQMFDAAAAYVVARAAPGSDPGLCLAASRRVAPEVIRFGWQAASEVVQKADATRLAAAAALELAELGGTGDGVIGALAAVGLTADGNNGRFLEWGDGLRGLDDPITADALRGRGIRVVSCARNADPVPPAARIQTGDWVRPRLIGGEPVLLVEATPDGWRCFDRKQRSEHDQREEP